MLFLLKWDCRILHYELIRRVLSVRVIFELNFSSLRQNQNNSSIIMTSNEQALECNLPRYVNWLLHGLDYCTMLWICQSWTVVSKYEVLMGQQLQEPFSWGRLPSLIYCLTKLMFILLTVLVSLMYSQLDVRI